MFIIYTANRRISVCCLCCSNVFVKSECYICKSVLINYIKKQESVSSLYAISLWIAVLLEVKNMWYLLQLQRPYRVTRKGCISVTLQWCPSSLSAGSSSVFALSSFFFLRWVCILLLFWCKHQEHSAFPVRFFFSGTWQVCLGEPFDPCNWSRMQQDLASCSWLYQI